MTTMMTMIFGMHSFNDWYLTQFCLPDVKERQWQTMYLVKMFHEDIAKVLINSKQSLFQFTGDKRNGAALFRNLKLDKSLVVKDKTIAPMFVKGDIFLARYFDLKG